MRPALQRKCRCLGGCFLFAFLSEKLLTETCSPNGCFLAGTGGKERTSSPVKPCRRISSM